MDWWIHSCFYSLFLSGLVELALHYQEFFEYDIFSILSKKIRRHSGLLLKGLYCIGFLLKNIDVLLVYHVNDLLPTLLILVLMHFSVGSRISLFMYHWFLSLSTYKIHLFLPIYATITDLFMLGIDGNSFTPSVHHISFTFPFQGEDNDSSSKREKERSQEGGKG